MKVLSEAQLDALPDPEWYIDGILPQRSLVVLYGPPGSGKTFVALSMALAVASNSPWIGRVTSSAPVLFIAAEGAFGMKYRSRAFKQHYGINQPLNIHYIPEPVNLLDPKQVEAARALIAKNHQNTGLIIIDTVARCFVGGDENSAKDMGLAVSSMDILRGATGATVLAIHHTTKNTGTERGSSALRGAADAMISCSGGTENFNIVALSCDKMKDAEPFEDMPLELKRVELGAGKSSLVIQRATGPLALTKKGGGNRACARALEILQDSFGESGATNGQWREAFEKDTGQSKATFDRSVRQLKQAKQIKQYGSGQGATYTAVSEKAVSVSPGCHGSITIPATGVSSAPPLGADTDTNDTNTKIEVGKTETDNGSGSSKIETLSRGKAS
ncbi:MAG: helicase RepA family protein [Rhodospirillaceae bacterium]